MSLTRRPAAVRPSLGTWKGMIPAKAPAATPGTVKEPYVPPNYSNAPGGIGGGTGAKAATMGNTQTVGVAQGHDAKAAIAAQQAQHADPANNLQGPGALERLYATSGSAINQPSATQDWWSQNKAQFAAPSMSETFAQQSLEGGNPFLERQRQQGMDAIDQRMAARGGYNSGAAAGALGSYNAELDAGAYAQMAGLAGQADQSRNARLSGGLAGSSGASGDALSRLNAQFTAAGAAQGAQEGRLNGQMDRRMALDNMTAQQIATFYGMGMQGAADPWNSYMEMLGGSAKEAGEAEGKRGLREWLKF